MTDGRTTGAQPTSPADATDRPAGSGSSDEMAEHDRGDASEFRGRLAGRPVGAGRSDQPTSFRDGMRQAFSGEEFRTEVVRQLGGWRGIAESAVPVVIFVAVNTIWGLYPGLIAAVGAAVLLSIFRLIRKQSPRQALNGLFGIAIAAFVAWRTGRAEDFYLPGIWLSYLYAVGIAATLFIRRPLVGLIWAFFGKTTEGWRENRRLYRTFWWLTVLWAAVWAAKVTAQAVMYYAGADATQLGIARLVLGNPPILLLLAITVWQVRRVTKNWTPTDQSAEIA